MKQSGGFLEEVQRRKVVRVAVVYGAVAFAVVQVADVAFPRIPLPDWTVSFVVWLAILGFPIALVLAWAFDMTPDGVKRTALESPAVAPEPGALGYAADRRPGAWHPRPRTLWEDGGPVRAGRHPVPLSPPLSPFSPSPT